MKELRTMVSPPPGFTDRVMTRIQIYHRAQAKRRMAITVGLLIASVMVLLVLIGIMLASWLDAFASLPSRMASLVIPAVSLAGELYTLFDALWLGTTTVASSINSMVFIAYACAVVVLTVLWVRIAVGPFQYPPANNLRRIEQ